MALNNQPYLPLYVDDWMNNTKLKMCCAAAHGVMITVMCIMHKEPEYGTMLLKQKFKQTDNQIRNFALQIAKLSNFEFAEIEKPLQELIAEGILKLDADKLTSPRMARDYDVSEKRANAGRNGGISTKNKKLATVNDKANSKAKDKANILSKEEANTVIEIEDENVTVNTNEKGKEGPGEKPNVAVSSLLGRGAGGEAVYPFASDIFATQWQAWKRYRATEHNFSYRSAESEQAALAELGTLANGTETTAIAIMHQSMGKGWKGFFELKQDATKPAAGKGKVRYSDDFKRKIASRLQSR
jgi:hypothetical protein